MASSILKSMLYDIINDRNDEAAASLHEYVIARTAKLTGLKEANDEGAGKSRKFQKGAMKKVASGRKWKPEDGLTSPDGTPSKEESDYMTRTANGAATWVPGKGWQYQW